MNGIAKFIITVLAAFSLGFVCGGITTIINYQEKAIEAGVAYYNPTNSQFTYKTMEK